MDFVAINGEVMKVLVDEFGPKRDRCHAFMLDRYTAKIKALDCLLINFQNAVGVRCFSHLLNNCGTELASREIDRFAGHLHVLLAHSHNAKDLWRRETKAAPPKPVSHRWSSRQLRSRTLLVQVWPGMKTLVDKSTSTEESKSKAAQALREEMDRVRPDGIQQELVLQVGFATAVDAGISLTPATHLLLEGDGFLVST